MKKTFGLVTMDRDAISRRHRLDRHRKRCRGDRAAQIPGIGGAAGPKVAALGARVARVARGLEPENRPILSSIGKPCDPTSQFFLKHRFLLRHSSIG
jgi:hypothetical protein